MRVYLNYNDKRCAYFYHKKCLYAKEGCYVWETIKDCASIEEINEGCPHEYLAEHIICKETKNIEIEAEFVRIGKGKKWLINEINLLKVDYGNGWVVEIGEE